MRFWGRAILGLALASLLLTGRGSAPHPVRANRGLPTDLSYSTETTWLLPGLPDLSATAGYIPHNFSHGEAIFQLDNETIHGFRPGKVYPEMYARDIAWGMETAQYYYPDEYLRDPIEAYLRRQYTPATRSLDGDFGVAAGAGAIGGIITPQGRSNKQTATTDEETSLIHAAYLYYNMTYNIDWLRLPINGMPLIDRLNLAADWLYAYRLDPQLQLLWRGHTTDWGDVKFEKGPGYTDYNPAQDHQTASVYDQALAYMALVELAKMNAAVGNTAQADGWQVAAENLKAQTNARLWQTGRGIYQTHAHITPLDHDFDEAAMVSIANALAVYAGLTDLRQSEAIFNSLETARLAAGVKKPGLSLYPYYPNRWPDRFFDYPGMGYGHYQNGGVWDWWGGVQIKAEFESGFSEMGRQHLLQVAHEWQNHPGNIIEWQSSLDADSSHEGSHYYSAAAGTMGSAIIEGLFGLSLTGSGLTLQPRLGLNDGYIRVYQPATDRYAAYSYDWDQDVTSLNYGTNAEEVRVKVLKLRSEYISQVLVDDYPVSFDIETIGHDTYTVLNAPGGEHRIEINKGVPQPQPTPTEIVSPAIGDSPPSVAPNLAPSPQLPTPEPSPQPTLEPTPSPAQLLNARHSQESRLAMVQFAGAGLIILTCLGLVLLVFLRRIGGL